MEGCEKTFLWIVNLQLEGWPGRSQSQREAHYDEDAALDFSSIVLADQSWVFRPHKNGHERRCDRSREDQESCRFVISPQAFLQVCCTSLSVKLVPTKSRKMLKKHCTLGLKGIGEMLGQSSSSSTSTGCTCTQDTNWDRVHAYLHSKKCHRTEGYLCTQCHHEYIHAYVLMRGWQATSVSFSHFP